MKRTVDYKQSEAPNFDAVNDVMDYLGDRYAKIAADMAKVTDPDMFAGYCGLAGIEGFPVRAWYDHFHGQGAWDTASVLKKVETSH